jgi:mannan endo-1,4-beta-mannosidase
VLWYMPWRNDPGAAGTGAYGTPVEGSRYAADFRRFTKHPFIRMANTLPPLY